MGHSFLIKALFITAFFTTQLVQSSYADKLLPEGIGVIDHILQSESTPSGVYFLIEEELGKIKKISSSSHLLGKSNKRNMYIIGVALPITALEATKRKALRFAIFSTDPQFGKQANPVMNWTSDKLIANTPHEAELKTLINEAKKEISLLISKRKNVEALLNPLQEKASVAGRVDEIIDLELELAALKQIIIDKNILIEKIDLITKSSRSLKAPANLDKKTSVLSKHLREAAKITSAADRLERRKQQIATKNFKRKLKAINEMEYADVQQMAREVLRLRKVREHLEQKLNLNSRNTENLDF